MSDSFGARIGRVRMKAGGAEVRVLHQTPANGEEDWRGKIVEHARHIAEQTDTDSELVGYFVMGIYSDGCTATGFRIDGKRSRVPKALLPSWIAEIVRRDVITGPEAEGVFDDKFEWVE